MAGGFCWRGFGIRTFLLVAVTCVSASLWAQTINGIFHGVVTDATGAVIPDARVEVRNQASGAVRQAVTNAVGFYTIPQLAPGKYTFSVTKGGFATARQIDVNLFVNQDLEVDFTLQVGAVTQEIQVTAAPPALETANATVGQVVGSKEVVELPLNGRQFTQLILLTPGAAPKEGGQQGAFIIPIGGGGLSPSVNGQRGQQNNFTLDGILNNAIFVNGWAVSPPPDAIQEFKVQSHIVDAQFSISSGANVNVVTRSGSDEIHGSAWEFVRNDKLDAADFFNNLAGLEKPPFRMNQYGVAMGGPVVLPKYDGRKERTHFFGYWEGFRSRKGQTQFANVPTAAEMSGNFSSLLTTTSAGVDALGRPILVGQIYDPYNTRQVTAGQVDPTTGRTATSTGLVRDPFSNNQVQLPGGGLTQEALTYLNAFFPGPNFGPGFPNFAAALPQKIDSDQFGIKVDHTFSNNDTLYGAFYFTNPDQLSPSFEKVGGSSHANHARQVALGYTHLFSPTLLSTFHYGYTRTFFTADAGTPAGEALLRATKGDRILPVRNNIPIVPQIGLAPRLSGTGQFAIPLGPIRSQMVSGDIQKISGSHTLSGGFMFYRIHSFDDGWGMSVGFDQFATSAIDNSGLNVSTTGDGLGSMLLNLPSNIFGFLGATEANTKGVWQAYYLQDKWQVSKKLNIQWGLRYDFVPPLRWKDDQVSGFDIDCGCYKVSQAFPPTFAFANVRKTYFDPRYGGLQPRFGFAYSPTDKTVIRGAFAKFDDHNNTLVQMTQDPRIKWPWGVGASLGALNRGIPSTFYNNLPPSTSFFPTPGVVSPPQIAFSANPRNKIPYALQWNFGIQRALTNSITASVDYVGSVGRHLFIQPMANAPTPDRMGSGPVAPRTPHPEFGQFPYSTNEGTSNYNGLQVKVEKRFAQGLSFLGSYTWSHCLSIQDEGQSGTIQNPYNVDADYGSCDYDFRHLFIYSYVYELPIGKGKHFGGNWGGVNDAILGGWKVSGITSLYSGSPFTASVGFDNANINPSSETQRADLVGDPLPPGFTQTREQWYSRDAFRIPAQFTFGNLGRNTLRGPGLSVFDVSLAKEFDFTETKRLEFRADFFNVANHTNLSPPGGVASPGFTVSGGAVNTPIAAPTFMQIFGAGPPRDIQLSLKLVW